MGDLGFPLVWVNRGSGARIFAFGVLALAGPEA